MNFYKKIFITVVTFITLLSCDNFGDMNDDPNAAVSVPSSALLTTAQYNLYSTIHGVNMNAGMGMLMVQYWAQNEYAGGSRYDFTETSFDGSWRSFYTNILKELDAAKEIIKSENISDNIKANRLAIIDVMKVQVFSYMTDAFGDIPYSDALTESTLPSYDSQEQVYKGILETLDNAYNSFDDNAISFNSGDIVFGGKVSKWKTFTKSLMLRLAMRIADVDASTATTYANKASSDLISDNADNALFVFSSNANRANPLFRNADPQNGNRDDYSVTKILVDKMENTNDPRISKYAKKTSTGVYKGMPYGLTDSEATALQSTTSRPSDLVRSAQSPYPIITYSEVQFLLAEAYQRNILTGDAKTAYENGIKASMNFWEIDNATANAYISSQPYNTSNWKESIGTQKWLALYPDGFQAWAEWRRLDYPSLPVPAAATISSIPVRLPYPLSEISNNSVQLSKVTSTPTSMTDKLWWDVN